MNPFTDFIADMCTTDPKVFVPVAELRQSYDDWAIENGGDERLSASDFNTAMTESGYKRTSTRVDGKPAKCWRGICLRKTAKRPNK